MEPSCFVSMPFGTKTDQKGGTIDFELVYQDLIKPAVLQAGLASWRADDAAPAGLLMPSIMRRLIASQVAVIDITTLNPNVLYELGIRQAMRPTGTLVIASQETRAPWDLNGLRVLAYQLNTAGRPVVDDPFRSELVRAIRWMLESGAVDSPVYAFVPEIQAMDLSRISNDTLTADRRAGELRRRIEEARGLGDDELVSIEREIGVEISRMPDVGLTLFEAYRGTGAWQRMVDLARKLPPSVASSTRVQEQVALALNRVGASADAEQLLRDLLAKNGPSTETCGILGRVYKDRWQQALKAGDREGAASSLTSAIAAYLTGFETDWREPYPGVNAVTLMEFLEQPDPRRDEVLPVVFYAVRRRLEKGRGDYWDLATLLELNVLADKRPEVRQLLTSILSTRPNEWQLQSTAHNLHLIAEARERRGVAASWVLDVAARLNTRAL